jgi:hypothetical protein
VPVAGDWVKVHRSLLEHPVFDHTGLLKLWMLCLLKANWKGGRMLIRGTTQTLEVPRGTFVTSRESLKGLMYPERDREGVKIRYEHAPPSALTIWRWMHALEAMGSVKLENVNNHCTLVTICNYGSYQETPEFDEPPVNSRRTTDEQPMNRIEERQEYTLSLSSNAKFGRFDTPEAREAVTAWARYYPSRHNADAFTDLMLENLLMDRARLGWDADRLARSIRASIGAGAAHIFDADAPPPWAARRAATVNGGNPRVDRQPKTLEPPRTPPRRTGGI